MNQRGRDRVNAAIQGRGTVSDTGAVFSFSAADFSVMGMLIHIEGLQPQPGTKLKLEFQISDPATESKTVTLDAEVMRVVENGDVAYGIRWLAEKGSREVETLENYYIERFFDAME